MSQKQKNLCMECKTEFCKVSNLRAHVKKKHPDKLDALCPKKRFQSAITCNECMKGFVNKANLKIHIKHKHPNKASLLAAVKSNKIGNPLKCTLCIYTNNSKEEMIKHFTDIHDIEIAVENYEFSNFDNFSSWKSKIEKQTSSSFVNTHGSYKTIGYSKINYNCNRSGQVRQRGTGKRHLKTQGSKKINGFCPARMSVVIEDGKCKVKFFKTHVGHKKELGHLFLTDSERNELAAKIAAKIPFQTILDNIRDSISNCNLERFHLLKKKDLYNIEQCFQLNKSSVRHANDAISIEAWVNQMQSSVLLYKPQGSLCEKYQNLNQDDFALVIMTQGQIDLLKSFGNDSICIDGTHGLNGYGFEMHTLLVLDDLREGYPCAFLISNRSDEDIIKIFFSCVKETVGERIKCRVFMSDMADVYYNAWLQIMQPSEMRLFCTWHVDRAWRNNLDKLTTKEKRATMYKMLRKLLHETDGSAFLQMINNFVIICKSDPETSEFGNYFERYYRNRAKHWAYCYRLNSRLNTNMHLERMHRTIKYLYLDGKFVKRLDKAVNAIMKFARDKLFERLIVIHKGKICSKLKDLRSRHKTSEDLTLDLVVESDVGWEIASSSMREIYVVQEVKENCQCELLCTECNACLHKYSCTCLDSTIKWNMCKHIHMVCRYRKQHSSQVSEIQLAGTDVEENNLYIEIDSKHTESLQILESLNELQQWQEPSTSTDTLLVQQQKLVAELSKKIYSTHLLKNLMLSRDLMHQLMLL